MKFHCLLLIVYLSVAPTSFAARNHALIVGGGCSNKLGPEMAHEVKKLQQSLNHANWNTMTLFGGKQNEKDLGDTKSYRFTKDSLIKALEIEAASLHANDQLLLTIETHGNQSEGGHKICLGNNTWMDLSDPDVMKSFQKLKENGVKIGVLDNSCYGGETVQLLSPYGCVVSTQVATQESIANELHKSNEPEKLKAGVSTFARQLMDQAVAPTLEDVFIKTSLELDAMANFPQMTGVDPLIQKSGDNMAAWMFAQIDTSLSHQASMGVTRANSCNPNIDQNFSKTIQELELNLKHEKWFGLIKKREVKNSSLNRYQQLKEKLDPLNKRAALIEKEAKAMIESIRKHLETEPVSFVDQDQKQELVIEPGSNNFWSEYHLLSSEVPVLQGMQAIPYRENTKNRPMNRKPNGLDDRGDEYMKLELKNRWGKIEKIDEIKKLQKLQAEYQAIITKMIPLEHQSSQLLSSVSSDLNHNRIRHYLSNQEHLKNRACRDFKLR